MTGFILFLTDRNSIKYEYFSRAEILDNYPRFSGGYHIYEDFNKIKKLYDHLTSFNVSRPSFGIMKVTFTNSHITEYNNDYGKYYVGRKIIDYEVLEEKYIKEVLI